MYTLEDIYNIFTEVLNQNFFTEFGIETLLVGLVGVSLILLLFSIITGFFNINLS